MFRIAIIIQWAPSSRPTSTPEDRHHHPSGATSKGPEAFPVRSFGRQLLDWGQAGLAGHVACGETGLSAITVDNDVAVGSLAGAQ